MPDRLQGPLDRALLDLRGDAPIPLGELAQLATDSQRA